MDNDTTKTLIDSIIDEYRSENQTSPFRENTEFEKYVKEGIYSINDCCGTKVDYTSDLEARSLLKNYILYADHKRLAEFKTLYAAEYDKLQRDYYVKLTAKSEEED